MLKLNNILFANALFTLGCAITIFLGTSVLRSIFGLNTFWILPALGIGLLIYAIDLYVTSRSKVISSFKAIYFIAMDAIWVLGSGALIILFQSELSQQAILIIDLVAFIVGIFGFLQYLGYQKLKNAKKV